MGLWFRVFGASSKEIEPSALSQDANSFGVPVEVLFHSDDGGWTSAELHFGEGTPIYLERFLATEEGMRTELNTWAAYIETCDYAPNHVKLMERMIQTAQMFTLRKPIDHADEVQMDRLCFGICSYLAQATDGFFQVDDQGFFTADGTILLQEY